MILPTSTSILFCSKLVFGQMPPPPGDVGLAHDGCLFRGGTLDHPKSTWNKNSLYHKIPPRNKAIGDSLYCGMPHKCTVAVEGHNDLTRNMIKKAKALQENYHGRMQEFHGLEHCFRHGNISVEIKMSKHKSCFESNHVLFHFDLQHWPLGDC